MQMAAMVQSQAAAVGLAPAGSSGGPLSTFFGCGNCTNDPMNSEDEEAPEDVDKGPGTAPPTIELYLRLCIYKAHGIPVEKTYVSGVINEGKEDEKRFKTPVHEGKATAEPFYRWCYEEKIAFSAAQSMELSVTAPRSMGSDVVLGKAVLALTAKPQEPKFLSIPLIVPQSTLGAMLPTLPKALAGETNKGSLTIVYQLVKSIKYAPELLRIADLGWEGTEIGEWNVTTVIHSAGLREKPKQDSKAFVRVMLEKPVDNWKSEAHDSPRLPLEKNEGEHGKNYKGYWETNGEQGWAAPEFLLSESKATMMHYVLVVELWSEREAKNNGGIRDFLDLDGDSDKPPEQVRLGVWRETVHDLFCDLEARKLRLRFDAVMTNEKDQHVGLVRLELDIYRRHGHGLLHPLENHRVRFHNALAKMDRRILNSMQALNILNPLEVLPIRLGMPRESLWHKDVIHYITIAADGLVLPPGAETCNPYVKITVGEQSVTSYVKHKETNHVEWGNPLTLKAKVIDRVAKIQIFNAPSGDDESGGVEEERELICQAELYDVRHGVEYWLHCQGAAIDAPKKDTAKKMTAGLVHPASTYRGTITITFSAARRETKAIFYQWHSRRLPGQLSLRLYTGLFFTCFAGRSVVVLVQILGCRFPDHYCRTDEDAQRPRRFNRNLLSFEGSVDKDGTLTLSKEGKDYVERQTPAEVPLAVPPNALSAYIYIAAKGSEQKMPPKVFGVVPFITGKDDVRWHRMRFDQSVTDYPEAKFPNDCAGYIMGMARVLPVGMPQDAGSPQSSPTGSRAGSPQPVMNRATSLASLSLPKGFDDRSLLPEESSAGCCGGYKLTGMGSPGIEIAPPDAKPKRKLFVHVDMLVGRNFPANDEGRCTAVFTIRVNKKVFHQAEDITPGTNPLFMRRVVIPIQVSAENLPLPPLIVQVHDTSTSGTLTGRSGDLIGSAVVEHKATYYNKAEANSEGKLDLDSLHKAFWLALDSEKRADFLPEKIGGIDHSWLNNPTILMAVCFSEVSGVVGTDWGGEIADAPVAKRITTPRNETYQIEFSLLGLRNLPERMAYPELVAESFWDDLEGSSRVAWELPGDDRNPNIGPGAIQDVQAVQKKLQNLINVRDDLHPEPEEDGFAAPDGTESEATASTDGDKEKNVKKIKPVEKPPQVLPEVMVSTLMGDHTIAPAYKALVVGYLQPDDPNSTNGEPFVFLPNINFSIRNSRTGYIYATASAQLNQLRRLGGGPFERDWPAVAADELSDLLHRDKNYWPPRELESLGGLIDNNYQVSIDVFAAKAGFLKFDPDTTVGRLCSSTELFTISDDDEIELNEITQYFNPWDFMAGSPLYEAECFDERVTPAFVCDNRSDPKHKMPIDAKSLLKPILSGAHLTKFGTKFKNTETFLATASTGDFCRNA